MRLYRTLIVALLVFVSASMAARADGFAVMAMVKVKATGVTLGPYDAWLTFDRTNHTGHVQIIKQQVGFFLHDLQEYMRHTEVFYGGYDEQGNTWAITEKKK